MAKSKLVNEAEYRRLLKNLKPGEILSVDLVDDARAVPKGEIEVPYGAEDIHEAEGYSVNYEDAMEEQRKLESVPVSEGGYLLDESEGTYNGEPLKDSSHVSWIK